MFMEKMKHFFKVHLCNIAKLMVSSEEAKIIYAYRYLSLSITSFVYFTGEPNSIITSKLGVIISLFISSVVFTDLYMKFSYHKKTLKVMLLSETLGITLLLIPTSGLTSPFIWYALNPTIIAAYFLPSYFCWINLIFYIFTGAIVTYYVFNTNHISLFAILAENYNLMLAFVLITLAVQLLSNMTNTLSQQSYALRLSNQQREESMNYIMTLYQVIEAVDNHISVDKLFETLANYTSNLMRSNLCIYWLPGGSNGNDIIQTNQLNSTFNFNLDRIIHELKNSGLNQLSTKNVSPLTIDNYHFLTIPIYIPSSSSGLIAIELSHLINKDLTEQNIRLLEFLSGLSTVTLERFHLEEIEDQLLVNEEQNRIANEMHDSVSQRLFSISYGIHGLLKGWKRIPEEQLEEYLLELYEASQHAMEELRSSIYKLSSKKKDDKSFYITLKTFLDSLALLHHITINYTMTGDELTLSLTLKQVIIRIIREACSNAIRHGNSSIIELSVHINNEIISISIHDNGKGFHLDSESNDFKKGLGLSNIRNLISSCHGTMNIASIIDKGTNIQFTLPLKENYIDNCKERIAI